MKSEKFSADYLLSDATPTDASSVCTLVNSAYRGESSKKGWTTEADLLGGQRVDVEGVLEILRTPNRLILLLKGQVTGKIAACVSLDFSPEACDGRERACYLGMLTVDPNLQASGLGKRMMKEAEKTARDRRVDVMFISVIQLRTELIDWYRRHGYRPNGKTKPFPYGDQRFGDPKRRDLHFVLFEKRLI
jgi:ribosomal protein S18 acetylase RimI-like enzyme